MGVLRDIFELVNQGMKTTEDGDPDWFFTKKRDQRNNAYSSISRRAAEGTLQFPMVVSRANSFESVQRIANAHERACASFAQIVFTMNPQMDLAKGDALQYLRDFHQNMDTTDDLLDELHQTFGESMQVDTKLFQATAGGLKMLEEELKAYGADYRTGTLNDVLPGKYVFENTFILPTTYEERKNGQKSFKIVTEADRKSSPDNTTLDDLEELENKSNNVLKDNGHDSHGKPIPEVKARIHLGSRNSGGNGGNSDDESRLVVQRNLLRDNDAKKANELVPTLLHIRVIATDSETKSGVNKYVDFVVGVKSTIHLVTTEEVVDELVDACRNHDGFFKFIKWTTGEINFVSDFVLNLHDSQKDIAKQSGGQSHWWNALKHRGTLAKMHKWVNTQRQILPNATILITQEECDFIKNTYGFDLMNPGFVEKIMKKFFLLCFIVTDDALEVAHFKYDGQKSYQTISYAGLEKENSNGARQFKDILHAVQRI